MAEKTAVLGRVAFRQGDFALWIMAGFAILFRFLFVHAEIFAMDFVIRKMFCGLGRGAVKEKKDSTAEKNKDDVKKP